MDIDIIIQGKPSDEWSEFTPNIDSSLRDNIIRGLFESFGLIGESEVLLTRIISWRGTLYSVYTLWIEKPIAGFDGRGSFFAFSVVCRGWYFITVSKVYENLENVFKEAVREKYIDANAKYIEGSTWNKSLFENLTQKTKDLFCTTDLVFEDLKQQLNIVTDNDGHYSVLDCDSKAFLNDLLKYRRIIVSEKTPDKNSIIESNNKELAQYKERLREVSDEAKRYKKTSEQLKNQLDDAKDSCSKSEENKTSLKSENEKLRDDFKMCKRENDTLKKKMVNAIKELGGVIPTQKGNNSDSHSCSPERSVNNTVYTSENGAVNDPPVEKKNDSHDYLRGIVVLVAVVLLVIFLCYFIISDSLKSDGALSKHDESTEQNDPKHATKETEPNPSNTYNRAAEQQDGIRKLIDKDSIE